MQQTNASPFFPDFKGGSCVPLKKSLRTLFEDFFFLNCGRS